MGQAVARASDSSNLMSQVCGTLMEDKLYVLATTFLGMLRAAVSGEIVCVKWNLNPCIERVQFPGGTRVVDCRLCLLVVAAYWRSVAFCGLSCNLNLRWIMEPARVQQQVFNI